MDTFTQRKESILLKDDKSTKKSWDEKIENLCGILNENIDYYTTSSCSGKSVLIEEKTGKNGTYYLWTSHNIITFDELKKELLKIKDGLVKFKCEAPILHVGCRTLGFSQLLVDNAKKSGFKRTGIMTTYDKYMVEVGSAEKIECHIVKDGEILVSDKFLMELVNQSNLRRKNGWKKIQKLSQLIL